MFVILYITASPKNNFDQKGRTGDGEVVKRKVTDVIYFLSEPNPKVNTCLRQKIFCLFFDLMFLNFNNKIYIDRGKNKAEIFQNDRRLGKNWSRMKQRKRDKRKKLERRQKKSFIKKKVSKNKRKDEKPIYEGAYGFEHPQAFDVRRVDKYQYNVKEMIDKGRLC